MVGATEMKNMQVDGKIYAVKNELNEIVYIGSTILNIEKRESCHRTLAITKKTGKNNRLHLKIREGEDLHFEILKIISGEPQEELKLKMKESELDYIKIYKPIYNNNSPCRTNEDLKNWFKLNYHCHHCIYKILSCNHICQEKYEKNHKCKKTETTPTFLKKPKYETIYFRDNDKIKKLDLTKTDYTYDPEKLTDSDIAEIFEKRKLYNRI